MDLGIIKDKLLPAEDKEVAPFVVALADGRDGRLPDRLDDSLTLGRGLEVSFELEAAVDRVICEDNEASDVVDSVF